MGRDRFDEIRDQVNVVFESLRGDIHRLASHAHVVTEIATFGEENGALRGQMGHLREETRAGFQAVRAEVAALDRRVTRLEPKGRRP